MGKSQTYFPVMGMFLGFPVLSVSFYLGESIHGQFLNFPAHKSGVRGTSHFCLYPNTQEQDLVDDRFGAKTGKTSGLKR